MKSRIKIPRTRVLDDTVKGTGSNVFSSNDFKALVRYERLRSDRNGSIFSVAVFGAEFSNIDFNNTILPILSRLSRSIDCIGMVDNEQLAVLLPDTEKTGADTFGNKVLAELKTIDDIQMTFCTYSYPENWLSLNEDVVQSGTIDTSPYASIKETVELMFVDMEPAWKRLLDVVGSIAMLITGAPIFLLLSIYIKLISPGPVFFKQIRIGFRGKPFTFWKFRTMNQDNDQGFHGAHAQSFILDGDVPMEKLDSRDPRIILGGKAIRKSCLDELPQLWNVLRGDMSLVGPRPCIPYEAREYLRWHTYRFDVLPGLSGLWQVSGKNKLSFKQMIRLDISYCQNISLFNDLVIIARTPFAIIAMISESIAKKFGYREGNLDRLSLNDAPKGAMQ